MTMTTHAPHARRLSRSMAGVVALLLSTGVLAACSSSSSPTASTSSTPPAATTPSAPAASSTPPASSAPASPAVGPLSGKWTGSYSGDFTGTFTLTWVESSGKLAGTIDLSTSGTVPLNGTVSGDTITFGTVGTQKITYSGTVSGDTMSGTYSVAGSAQGSWQAHRTS